MKIVYFVVLVFLSTQQRAKGAVVRQSPAFAKPIFSNSYLPAAMQVIFHAVEQLKNLEAEEAVTPATTSVPNTSPHAPGQHQPTQDEIATRSTDSTSSADSTTPLLYVASTISEAMTSTFSEASTASIASMDSGASTPLFAAVDDDAESSATVQQAPEEIGETNPETAGTVALEAETPEENYATPETNHEIQEPVQETAETNEEVSEKIEDEEATSGVTGRGESVEVPTTAESKPSREQTENSSEEVDDEKSSSEESEESKEESDESKSLGSSESESEQSEESERRSAEEEDDEIRFTLIGEKVSQVPRPSLMSYLRKTAKAPLRSSAKDLASLYDALSKDARKQGLAKYSGYSDEVLETLENTVESGVGPQLLMLLEKAVERNELTRDDAKMKILNTLNQLGDPATILSRDLRRLVPLRFVP